MKSRDYQVWLTYESGEPYKMVFEGSLEDCWMEIRKIREESIGTVDNFAVVRKGGVVVKDGHPVFVDEYPD